MTDEQKRKIGYDITNRFLVELGVDPPNMLSHYPFFEKGWIYVVFEAKDAFPPIQFLAPSFITMEGILKAIEDRRIR